MDSYTLEVEPTGCRCERGGEAVARICRHWPGEQKDGVDLEGVGLGREERSRQCRASVCTAFRVVSPALSALTCPGLLHMPLSV